MRNYHLARWGVGLMIGLLIGVVLGQFALHDVVSGGGIGALLGVAVVAAGMAVQDGNRHAHG
jgi:hypothetical protein